MRKLLAVLLILSASLVHSEDNLTIIKNSLKNNLPELKIDKISPTAVPNIYEIISDHKVFYVDSSARYAFLGNMVDLTTKQSLTQAQVERLTTVDWSELPIKIAMRQIIGKGERRIAIFTDPNCPFCKHLEQDTIPKLTNVTIYYFLLPLPMHASSESDSKNILCAENPELTFRNWMIKSTPLPTRKVCKNSGNLKIMQDLGNKLGIEATPTIILPNGKLLSGLVPPDYLAKLINDTSNNDIKKEASSN